MTTNILIYSILKNTIFMVKRDMASDSNNFVTLEEPTEIPELM